MSDQSAVVWTAAYGEPRKLGLLLKAAGRVRFTYDPDSGDLPGLSVVHDTAKLAGRTVEYASTDANPLPPMLQALVPPRAEGNLQRRVLTRILERDGAVVGSAADVEWRMLVMAGRNGIGHLDVFASDEAAAAHYGTPSEGLTMEQLADRSVVRLVLEATAPTADAIAIEKVAEVIKEQPSVMGMMPKLLVRILRDGGGTVDALVKIGSPDYPEVLALENLAYSAHALAGFDDDRPRRRHFVSEDGIELLAVERFDRKDGLPIPMESAFTALYAASAGKIQDRWSMNGLKPSLEDLLSKMSDPRAGISVDPQADKDRLFTRTMMGLLTGNGDNHLENHAFLGRRGRSRLSPLYDPAPMRQYHRHQMVSSMSFGGVAFNEGAVPSTLPEAILAFGKSCGLQKRGVASRLDRCLTATDGFGKAAENVAPRVGKVLAARIEGIRFRVEKAWAAAAGVDLAARPKPADPAPTFETQGPSWT
ncbi:type II toxin-antitoxin system HipA family toxin [Fulvimarina endophytica]|uniref:Type II toxin-antitoxin system HipA family toxin n=1 Tax=Fulvimarina endophytica TaxID=2293836 RepID=A0A371X0G5_9HYPH|nr:HipA domain-containing protein [Fulvimarina endophytica]RFC62733.1 type II toxin-antitoxin system HipA family toxin [Fulvimarina endophytica]